MIPPLHIALWLLLFYLCALEALEASRHMLLSSGVYCSGSVVTQTAALSAMGCAMTCSSDGRCVAFSLTASHCILHDDFCGTEDLLQQAGSFYAEVKWESIGSAHYYMPSLKTPKSKGDADAVCEAMGAHVVAPETAEENEAVRKLVYETAYYPAPGTNGETHFWIDLINDVTWRYSGETASFTSWTGSEPNGASKECTMFKPSGGWADVHCSRLYSFLCEK